MKTCELCKREVNKLTKHHLVPKQKGGKKSKIAMLCLSCASMVHKLFTNKELARKYNSIEKLLEQPKVQKYVSWVKR